MKIKMNVQPWDPKRIVVGYDDPIKGFVPVIQKVWGVWSYIHEQRN